jgi:peptide/nickel transport system substrate-binding protein
MRAASTLARPKLSKALGRLAFAAAVLLAPAGPAQAETTLRFIPYADLSVLDPHWTPGIVTRNFGYMVYDTLFAVDHNFKPQPQMVASWTVSDDKLTWDFTLREGLKWHSGGLVRAVDCVTSLKRWGARSGSWGQPLSRPRRQSRRSTISAFELC